MSHDLLINELSSRLTPVQRRNIWRETAMLAGLATLELVLFLALGLMRSDMVLAIRHPFMWWKLGSLAILVAISFFTAVRSFSPTISPRRGLVLMSLSIAWSVIAGTMIDAGVMVAPTLADRLLPLFGLSCAVCIVLLSLPMLGILSIFMRRGASAHAEGSAWAVGLAAGSWGAFVFAFGCSANDPLYVTVWYSVACGAIALIARLLLPRYAAL